MILELKDICKSYGSDDMKVPVLKNVSLSVEKGDYIAIMGPSGSGKSTTMNIIGCLDRFDSGTYLLDGEDVSEMNDDALSDVRLNKIGFVFQTFNLLPGETALENVALPIGGHQIGAVDVPLTVALAAERRSAQAKMG